MKNFKKSSAIALMSTAIIGAAAVAVPLMNATTLTAHASEVDVTLNSKTALTSSYTSQIKTPGANTGTFTVTNNVGAQANILLQTLKSAQIKIPAQLVNHITATGDADVTTQMGINLTNIPAIGSLLTYLQSSSYQALLKQLEILDSSALTGGTSNFAEVYKDLAKLGDLKTMDLANVKGTITIDGDVATVKFNDALVNQIATQLETVINGLETALNNVNTGSSAVGLVLQQIVNGLRPYVNTVLDFVNGLVSGTADAVSALGNVTALTTATIKFPVSLNVDKAWFEQYAPNGLTTKFGAGIQNTSLISWDFLTDNANANTNVVFADIVAPKTPVLSNVNTSSATVKAEAGSTVVIYNAAGAKIGTATAPGTADGKTQVSFAVKYTTQKAGAKITVQATDVHGNKSAKASATVPGAVNKPGTPATNKPGTVKPVKTQIVYRLYNPNTGEHFYPTSTYERDMDLKAGWRNEGTLETAPTSGKAIYRVYNPNAKGGDHYYTMSKYEASQLVSQGWKWDNNGKPVFYSGGTKPVYVAYNPNAQTGAHNYTMNKYEQNSLLKVGWKYGATAWYGLS